MMKSLKELFPLHCGFYFNSKKLIILSLEVYNDTCAKYIFITPASLKNEKEDLKNIYIFNKIRNTAKTRILNVIVHPITTVKNKLLQPSHRGPR